VEEETVNPDKAVQILREMIEEGKYDAHPATIELYCAADGPTVIEAILVLVTEFEEDESLIEDQTGGDDFEDEEEEDWTDTP
jgi:hypothetical protein